MYNYGVPLVLGLFALLVRAPGLGKWCLTSDEFFFSQPIAFILEKGIPELPVGELYTRGMALQYLTLFPVLIFDKWEFAIRVLPLLFGVATILIFYFFCRLFLPFQTALLSSIVLLFSSWHIEFSRFARFYSAFQFMFFVFLYALYIGYWNNNRKYQIMAWSVAFISVFIYEGAIFLPLVLLLPILLEAPADQITKRNVEILLVSTFLLISNYFVNQRDLLSYFIKDLKAFSVQLKHTFVFNLPSSISESGNNLPIILPNAELINYVIGHWAYVFGCVVLLVVAGKIYLNQRKGKKTYLFNTTLGIALLLPLFHQYMVAFFILGIVFLCREDVKKTFIEKKNIWLAYYFITLCFWIAVIYLAGKNDKILFFLVGYPPIKHSIITPFFLVLPKFSILMFLTIFIVTICNVFAEEARPISYILVITLYLILIMPVFKTPWKTTRYIFFFFPLFIAVLFGGFRDLVRMIGGRYSITRNKLVLDAIAIIPLFLFCFTEDFNVDHILNIASKESNFRMGKYEKLSSHWYPRVDLESPVRYVNRNCKEGDVVVLDDVVMSKYIEKPYLNYVYKGAPRFRYHARNGGTIEKWTGRRLLSTPEELASLVPNDNKSLWLIATEVSGYIGTSFAAGHFHTPVEIAERYDLNVAHRYVGLDGRVGAWEFKRSPDRHS